ncbi:MAG: hypothetical protein SGI92_22730 [Bryobacteraceae bacterium]|nr:hypothetical protein [Bryobacteraceae bacterium]
MRERCTSYALLRSRTIRPEPGKAAGINITLEVGSLMEVVTRQADGDLGTSWTVRT